MLPLTIAINPTKETNIQMILLEEDIQQLGKIKGKGEQTFNFSTLMQHVAFLLLFKITKRRHVV